jgi:NADH-quinone oxidoreductase subunit N
MMNYLVFPAILEQAFLLLMACLALLVSAFARLTHQKHVYYLVQFSLLATIFLSLFFCDDHARSVLLPHVANDALSSSVNALICLSATTMLIYAKPYILKHAMPLNEFSTLILFAVLGMSVLCAAHNVLLIYLGLELMSLSTYILVALRRDNAWAIEAGLKYFILGAIASGLLLYGLSLIFGVTHSLDIQAISAYTFDHSNASHPLFLIGLIFLVAGSAFKLGIAPFHMWVPDVYQGSPAPVATFIASAPKLAALVLLMRLFYDGMSFASHAWSVVFIALGLVSLAIGNIAALRQTQIKRLLAYSSIAQMGYVVLAFACDSVKGNETALMYMTGYLLASLLAFGSLCLLSKNNDEVQDIELLKGLSSRYPWLSFLLLMTFFSMAGIPPFVGFMTKLMVIESLMSAGLTWVAVVAILFAIVGAFYYLRMVKVMYFEKPDPDVCIDMSKQAQVTMTINGLLILFLGIFPATLIDYLHLF